MVLGERVQEKTAAAKLGHVDILLMLFTCPMGMWVGMLLFDARKPVNS